ncbi:WhiB family transcriptional regulator [Tsukamurella conjunctivitidis]|uniref:Transcriptional regulator WhiB n=1 Tax=Tsukamurella conjunctivitidis TaxID=2592068 RepID=A0A5C5RSI9_9ACTN|nr:WhiB family transcriptional regulator [Tsukamurella conjunctivitidis]TWS25572.1 WhiB family transcriptional regulator [Tsukamurella conjunctivitidis]
MNNPYALPTPITSRDDWRLKGACRDHDPEIWYPTDADRPTGRNRAQRATQAARITEAKRICHNCPILLTCRAHALNTHEDWGIWGGLTTEERHQAIAHRMPA